MAEKPEEKRDRLLKEIGQLADKIEEVDQYTYGNIHAVLGMACIGWQKKLCEFIFPLVKKAKAFSDANMRHYNN